MKYKTKQEEKRKRKPKNGSLSLRPKQRICKRVIEKNRNYKFKTFLCELWEIKKILFINLFLNVGGNSLLLNYFVFTFALYKVLMYVWRWRLHCFIISYSNCVVACYVTTKWLPRARLAHFIVVICNDSFRSAGQIKGGAAPLIAN